MDGGSANSPGEFLYRGVHAAHPAVAAAKQGIVIPGDVQGNVGALEHNLGGVSAHTPYTSWTDRLEIARNYANSKGPGGVILRVRVGPPPPDAAWSWEWSPDLFMEGERLMRGIRTDAEVLEP